MVKRRIFDELSYGKKNKEKKYMIKEGNQEGKIFTFGSIISFDGDIDMIEMINIKTKDTYKFSKNVEIELV